MIAVGAEGVLEYAMPLHLSYSTLKSLVHPLCSAPPAVLIFGLPQFLKLLDQSDASYPLENYAFS